MFKLRITFIAILILLINSMTGNSQQSNPKNILILFSLSPAQPAYLPILNGIRQKLNEVFGDKYNLHLEYIDLENQAIVENIRQRFESYNEKYRELKLDLLICVGRNAVTPIKNYAESYLLNLPTISIDFDFKNYGVISDLSLNEQSAIIGMKFNIDKTISTALSLIPNISTVYFIGGTATFDKFMMSIATEAAQRVGKHKKAIIMTDLSMDMILQQVRNLPDSSLIFVPSFNTDSKSVPYYNPESIRLISKGSNSPVFAYSDMGFGDGAVGGYILSFRKIGLRAGETAVKILNGADPDSFTFSEQDYYEYIFDWRELKRWNLLNSELIPAGSTIMYEDISFVDRYKWIGGLVLLFLVFQTLLIANLIRLNRNQKLMTIKIIESENRYREFLAEDRSLRLGQLTASLSHELNQPLTAILSNAQAGINFINSNEATPDLLKEIFQKIVDNDKRGAAILSSIRGMMKLESREKEKADLNSLIQEVVDVFRSEARKQSIKIFVHMFNEPVYIMADKIQIQQVMLNLFFNALQSMQNLESDNRSIEIFQSLNDDIITISVCDSGKGIDESIKDTVFKPFLTSKKEGMGIGLAICRTIIEDHNGKIWAENMQDGGAKFSFSLKIYDDE